MKATIICIGDEVLCGDTLNSNATFLAKELTQIGVEVIKHIVVSDNEVFLEHAFNEAVKISDLVITTGGLGPTKDDMTKQTLAKLTNSPLEQSEEAVKMLEKYFEHSKNKLTPNNYTQTYFPKGATILENKLGTAPGALMEKEIDHKDITIFMVPGPPREMKNMYNVHIKKYLLKKTNKVFCYKDYMTTGIGESAIEYDLRKLLPDIKGINVNTYFNESGVKLKAVSNADNIEKAEENLKIVDKIIMDNFSEYIYSLNGETLPEMLTKMMKKNNLTLSVAESCTGGLLSSLITELSGVSSFYNGGVVSYSNEIKERVLNVKKETLEKYGAVSSKCVEEMAKGVAKLYDTDCAISISGVAGPEGGSDEKPVGTVYMGYYYKGKITTEKRNITGVRKRVQTRSAYYAMDGLRKIIKENID